MNANNEEGFASLPGERLAGLKFVGVFGKFTKGLVETSILKQLPLKFDNGRPVRVYVAEGSPYFTVRSVF